MVISLVKFQTKNTYVAAKNKIIVRYMYIYTWYARFFNAWFACTSFLSRLLPAHLFYELCQVSVAACHFSS